ncbi:MAG: hypothetical protein ACTSWD_08100 [Candidatus Heimdallarchaeota archaeon]
MWRTKNYIINLCRYSKDTSQSATCRSSEVTNKDITIAQYKRIMKIIEEK